MLFPHLNHTPHINTLCKNAHVNPTGWTFLDFLSDPPWSGSIVCHLAKPKVVELFSFLLCWRTLIPGERWFGRMTISAKNKPTSDLSFDLQKQASFIHFQSQRPSKDGSKKPTIPAAGTGWNPQTPRNPKKKNIHQNFWQRLAVALLRCSVFSEHFTTCWPVPSSFSFSCFPVKGQRQYLITVCQFGACQKAEVGKRKPHSESFKQKLSSWNEKRLPFSSYPSPSELSVFASPPGHQTSRGFTHTILQSETTII